MPNIVITEGLSTPWELPNTESNITSETDLDKLHLANQIVGELALESSRLLTSLRTETINLDKIVDAIEDISEEIALFPSRIAKWDGLFTGLDEVDMNVIPLRDERFGINIATANDVTETELSSATLSLLNFNGQNLTPSELDRNRKIIDSVAALISAKPLLDTQNFNNSRIGAAILFPPELSPAGKPTWFISEPKIVEGTTPGTGGNSGDLVVYRDQSGSPISYEFVGNGRVTLPPDQVKLFFIPRDAAEKDLMEIAIDSERLMEATNALINTTGLPSGVTPAVTTLGLSVEKYYDKARYEMTEYIRDSSSVIPTPNVYVTMFGDYPPIQKADLDLRKMTTADVGKYFQEPGIETIYYIAEVRTNGQVVVREALSTKPFIASMTDDLQGTLRGEYAEKQILLTQRSTEQTHFVTSISQRYTNFSDMATNLLKTLMTLYNELARNIRG